MKVQHQTEVIQLGVKSKRIESAFDELSTVAFATWIRLMFASKKDLSSRENVTRLLKYSSAKSSRVLKELKNKAYIRFVRTKGKRKTKIEILERAHIAGASMFVKEKSYAPIKSRMLG